MSRDKLMITGQLFFRETEMQSPDGSDIVMVVGMLAFDKPPKGEHKYTVTGEYNRVITLVPGSEEDFTEQARGQSMGGLLTQAMWRV
jgi:hypothetical protein